MAKDESSPDPFSDQTYDQFWLNNVFPDPGNLFAVKQLPVTDIKDTCLVALDANVLLLPYEMGAESFSKIADVYRNLCSKERLFVPAQAAREFVKNRASKLRDLIKHIGDQASTLNFSFYKEIGFLEKDPAFTEIKKQSEIVGTSRSKLLEEIKRLRSSLTDNVGSDPVSTVYQDLLINRVVSLDDSEKSRKLLMDEVKWRYRHKVPPGYKDGNKDDGGIGDFLIWKTILEHGKKSGNDCLFVTKDLKGDWWIQSQGAFQPRVELIEEYYRYTGGKTIHFLSLSSLLEVLEVSNDTVIDVKRVEANSVQQAIRSDLSPPNIDRRITLFGDHEVLIELPIHELIRMKRELDGRVLELFQQAKPIKRRLESPDLADAMDETSILDLYEQDKKLRDERIHLRSRSHRIQREILRRSSVNEE